MSALIGLIGVVIGGRALARSISRTRTDAELDATASLGGSTAAMALGLIGMVLGAVFVVTSDGGVGTGNGLGGAIVAIALGLIAMVLGGLAAGDHEPIR